MLAEINFQNMLAAHPLASEFSVPMQGTVSYVDRQRTLLSLPLRILRPTEKTANAQTTTRIIMTAGGG